MAETLYVARTTINANNITTSGNVLISSALYLNPVVGGSNTSFQFDATTGALTATVYNSGGGLVRQGKLPAYNEAASQPTLGASGDKWWCTGNTTPFRYISGNWVKLATGGSLGPSVTFGPATDASVGPWQGGGNWYTHCFILVVSSTISLTNITVKHAQTYEGNAGCLIDPATSSTGNTTAPSGSLGTGTKGSTTNTGDPAYTTPFTFNNLQLSPGNYQVTFDGNSAGNSSYRSGSTTSVTNGTITIYGYGEATSVRAAYNNCNYFYEAIEVKITYNPVT